MGQKPSDDRKQPPLELPSLLSLLRRRTRPLAPANTDAKAGGRSADTEGVDPADHLQPPDGTAAATAPHPPTEPARGEPLLRVPGRAAAALTGVVVGAAGAGATYAAMLGCEGVRGTSSCGGGPGFVLLVAIVALMVLLGAGLLRALSVDQPTSTSVLAVGMVVVAVMLFLLDAVFSGWMFAAVPSLGAGAFLLAHWVTTRFGDEVSRA
jgi:hypothetical protein